MAHECPECGQTCYCGGDVDDCEFHDTPEEGHCTHYLKCEHEWDELHDDDFLDMELADPAEPGIDADPGL